MRKTPLILAAFFIFVTMSRVSHYSAQMGDKTLSVAFSIGLGSVIFVSSYWTQYQGNTNPSDLEKSAIKKTIWFAWLVLFIATVIDGVFNLADVLSTNPPEFSPFIYGITPTMLSLLLGILQARIDTIPILRRGSSYKLNRSIIKNITAFFDRIQPDDQPHDQPQKAKQPHDQPDDQPHDQPQKAKQPHDQPEPPAVIIPDSYPINGSSRAKVNALLEVNAPGISGDALGEIIGISGGRARDLKRQILNSNGSNHNGGKS